jgi:hypothetical protein
MNKIPLAYNVNHPRAIEREDIRIVAAGVRQGEFVYTGWRHAEIILDMREAGLGYVSQDDQGFVDQGGFFYRRSAAGVIVRLNKQADFTGHVLTSEDLWDVDGVPK